IMAKQEVKKTTSETPEKEQPKKIVPEVTKSERAFIDPDFHSPGNYLLEMGDGSLISVTPRMYERAYKHNPNNKVKKSPNQQVMKLTQSEAMELLKSIGVDAELVEEQEASEFDMNGALSSIDNNRRGILKPIIEDELRDEITGHIAGKVGGTLERALVSLTGVNIKDIQGIADKEKIEKAITHYKTTLSKEQEEIASQIDEISSANQAAIDALKEEYEQKLQVANQRYIDRDINEFL